VLHVPNKLSSEEKKLWKKLVEVEDKGVPLPQRPE
jgi:hypothetical protein